MTSPFLAHNKKEETLKRRAEKLAKAPQEEKKEPSLEVIIFNLAEDSYAIELPYIKEIYSLKGLTPLPGLPPFIKGIISIRRRILSVVDLTIFLGLSKEEKKLADKVIILENKEREFGLLAEEIKGIFSIPIKEIQSPPPSLAEHYKEFIKGITSSHLTLLDGNKLLNSKKMMIQI